MDTTAVRSRDTRIIGVVVALVLLATSCGSGQTAAAVTAAESTTTTTTTTTTSTSATTSTEPQQLRYGDDPAQFGWLSLPADVDRADAPVVVLVHGGFWSEPWDYTLMSPLASDLVDRGYAVWNIEFRRVGGRGGWPTTFDDVGAAIDYLSEVAEDHALDLDRVALVGHSSGGHLALWAAGRPAAAIETQGAIGLGAVVDLEAFPQAQALLGGNSAELPEVYAQAAPSLDPSRVALVHGSADAIVPAATLEPARQAGVVIEMVQGADHFEVIDSASSSWQATLTLLEGFGVVP